MAEPENFILVMLREMRAEMKAEFADVRANMATKGDIADVRSELKSLRADVAADLLSLEKRLSDQDKRLSEQIVGLRRAVVEYHSTVVGHGILIGELDERLRRVERHLDLGEAH